MERLPFLRLILLQCGILLLALQIRSSPTYTCLVCQQCPWPYDHRLVQFKSGCKECYVKTVFHVTRLSSTERGCDEPEVYTRDNGNPVYQCEGDYCNKDPNDPMVYPSVDAPPQTTSQTTIATAITTTTTTTTETRTTNTTTTTTATTIATSIPSPLIIMTNFSSTIRISQHSNTLLLLLIASKVFTGP